MPACKPHYLCQCLDHVYARELGVDVRHIRIAGGSAKLRALDPATRAILLQAQPQSPIGTRNPQKKHKGGLKALGMKTRVPAKNREELLEGVVGPIWETL